jgi:hypothetical protein
MSKKSIFIEKLWLAISIISLLLAIFETTRKSFKETYPFFVISAIAFLMYTVRKNIRKNIK